MGEEWYIVGMVLDVEAVFCSRNPYQDHDKAFGYKHSPNMLILHRRSYSIILKYSDMPLP